MKKLLAFGVIVLFLGLAIAPSINANINEASIESELVEITTEICGIDNSNINQKNVVTDRVLLIGKIIDFKFVNNYFSFYPINVLWIHIHISSDSQFVMINHIKGTGTGPSFAFEYVRFFGILKPNFICGIFYHIDTYEIFGERI